MVRVVTIQADIKLYSPGSYNPDHSPKHGETVKLRIFLIMVMLIASTVLVVKAIHRAMPPTVKIQDSTIVIYNNTSTNAWSNVPIEITSLGGNNYRVTNKSAMGIKRFII